MRWARVMIRQMVRLFTLFGALVLVGLAGAQESSPGVGAEHIRFGQSAALSGPASVLKTEMRRDIPAAFAKANRAGGISGRRLARLEHEVPGLKRLRRLHFA